MAESNDNTKSNVIITGAENGDYRDALMTIGICDENECYSNLRVSSMKGTGAGGWAVEGVNVIYGSAINCQRDSTSS